MLKVNELTHSGEFKLCPAKVQMSHAPIGLLDSSCIFIELNSAN
jgi:hypothetical protein